MANKNTKSLLGERFGRLLVLRYVGVNKHRQRMWQCLCDCGTVAVVRGLTLRSGSTASCGCYRRICAVTHGRSRNGTPEYRIWAAMLGRCKSDGHRNYGGRGIRVCKRWESFENFYADMGPRPSPKHSLDRENNDGDYTPENCRWATKKEQDRNRRTNRLITYGGETKPLVSWAEKIGIHPAALSWRLDHGWELEDVMTTPSRKG